MVLSSTGIAGLIFLAIALVVIIANTVFTGGIAYGSGGISKGAAQIFFLVDITISVFVLAYLAWQLLKTRMKVPDLLKSRRVL
uniref:Uncharacterized protein n=1 Tax=Pithovirus LCDPAC01 TaxID=2506600 RepID=A0A481YQB2_9VIRU|nr:MAG: hypothetical protein LCDPAC01_01020 [Pithovirus LCDPAC01]